MLQQLESQAEELKRQRDTLLAEAEEAEERHRAEVHKLREQVQQAKKEAEEEGKRKVEERRLREEAEARHEEVLRRQKASASLEVDRAKWEAEAVAQKAQFAEGSLKAVIEHKDLCLQVLHKSPVR